MALGVLYQCTDRRRGVRGISLFLKETKTSADAKLDWLGFGSLSVAIAATQVFLDRGAQLDWFSSFEILVEATIAASAFYIFLVHYIHRGKSFVNPPAVSRS